MINLDDSRAAQRPAADRLAAGGTQPADEIAGLVSVIVPAYNAAEYIGDCLGSIFAQSYHHYEILVVDDGSTDDTRQVLEPDIAANRIRYFYQENQGPGAARNLALRHARGEFIAFLDADDLWLPEKLEQQVNFLQRDPEVGLVYTDGDCFGEALSRTRRELARSRSRRFRRGNIFKDLLAGNFIGTTTVMVRHGILNKAGPFLEQIGGKRFSYCDDFEMWLRIARLCKIDFSPQRLVMRRVHPEQMTGNKKYCYRQLGLLYGYLGRQDYCEEKAQVRFKYLTAWMKCLAATILRA